MFYIIQTPGSSLERTNDISVKLQKIAEGVEGVNQFLP
jgi:HAE1 family hydrophobic/amphiphilic exporter-1